MGLEIYSKYVGYLEYVAYVECVEYSGYVGNNELDVGVLDFGVTLGSSFAFGSYPGIHSSQFSPYLNFSMLTITSQVNIDAETAEAVGARNFGNGPITDPRNAQPIVIPRIAGGFQITSGTFMLRLVGDWSIGSIPGVTAGIGFNY